MDLRLVIPPHRTYRLTLQLPVLSGLPFESSHATLRWCPGSSWSEISWIFRRTSQTALQRFQDFGLEVSAEFLRIVGIIRLAETFRKFPFVLVSNALVPETTDIQPIMVGWRLFT